MSIILTKRQVKQLTEYLDDGDDDTKVKIRDGERYGKKGLLISFPEYEQDGEYFIEKEKP